MWIPPFDSPPAHALAHITARSFGPPLNPTLRVTLNFHPDRYLHGIPILAALATDGMYRSQFETGTSNGGLTAYPGGNRWAWESRIFGGAYDAAAPSDRPKYGALNYRRRLAGGSPRFGSAHLRLRPEVLRRTTFCYPDSVFEPTAFGVSSHISLVAQAEADSRDALDDYIEAQVHGPLFLARDVEALVLDPSYRGTLVEELASRLPCPIEWHHGFRLPVETLRCHPEYRGPAYVTLGEELAQDGELTPLDLGNASRTGRYDPQDLKMVWHYVARFGDLERTGTHAGHAQGAA
ncbi:MAG: DUF3626 domain-containing protein [Brachymonas sp.]|nr:DUF3626 domain-containing protein [Brachymonas sp.]